MPCQKIFQLGSVQVIDIFGNPVARQAFVIIRSVLSLPALRLPVFVLRPHSGDTAGKHSEIIARHQKFIQDRGSRSAHGLKGEAPGKIAGDAGDRSPGRSRRFQLRSEGIRDVPQISGGAFRLDLFFRFLLGFLRFVLLLLPGVLVSAGTAALAQGLQEPVKFSLILLEIVPVQGDLPLPVGISRLDIPGLQIREHIVQIRQLIGHLFLIVTGLLRILMYEFDQLIGLPEVLRDLKDIFQIPDLLLYSFFDLLRTGGQRGVQLADFMLQLREQAVDRLRPVAQFRDLAGRGVIVRRLPRIRKIPRAFLQGLKHLVDGLIIIAHPHGQLRHLFLFFRQFFPAVGIRRDPVLLCQSRFARLFVLQVIHIIRIIRACGDLPQLCAVASEAILLCLDKSRIIIDLFQDLIVLPDLLQHLLTAVRKRVPLVHGVHVGVHGIELVQRFQNAVVSQHLLHDPEPHEIADLGHEHISVAQGRSLHVFIDQLHVRLLVGHESAQPSAVPVRAERVFPIIRHRRDRSQAFLVLRHGKQPVQFLEEIVIFA